MIFAASGVVLMDEELSHVRHSFPGGMWSGSQIRPGITIGVGAEAILAAFGGTRVRVEYLHNDFGTTTFGMDDPAVLENEEVAVPQSLAALLALQGEFGD